MHGPPPVRTYPWKGETLRWAATVGLAIWALIISGNADQAGLDAKEATDAAHIAAENADSAAAEARRIALDNARRALIARRELCGEIRENHHNEIIEARVKSRAVRRTLSYLRDKRNQDEAPRLYFIVKTGLPTARSELQRQREVARDAAPPKFC